VSARRDTSVDAAIAAARHLLRAGLLPMFDAETVDAIRRRDPELAHRLVGPPEGEQ
jgi:hypothetical protein